MSDFLKLSDCLTRARKVLVFTGAGVSTNSGIPDYRGPDGLWTRRRPVQYHDFMLSEEARIRYWQEKFDDWPIFQAARPTLVHKAIACLERAGILLAVITQNTDGLHLAAGTQPERLVELHGINFKVKCQSCGWSDEPERHFQSFRIHRRCPRCGCGGFLKPATISFGQNLVEADLIRAAQFVSLADLVVALGTSLSVYPASQFPLQAARRGIPYVIVNRGATDHDDEQLVTLRIERDVEEIFPKAVDWVLMNAALKTSKQ